MEVRRYSRYAEDSDFELDFDLMVGVDAGLNTDFNLVTGVMLGGGVVDCDQDEGGSDTVWMGDSWVGSAVDEGRQVLMVPVSDSGMVEGEVVAQEAGVGGERGSWGASSMGVALVDSREIGRGTIELG
jgi:hypothetical protein